MSIREMYIDRITCLVPTDNSALNNRDEVYFLVAGAGTKGEKIRVTPDAFTDYYGLAANQSATNILLRQQDMADGERLAFTIAICEQDNAQLGAIVSALEAVGLTIAAIVAEDPDIAEKALQQWVQTGIDLVESVQKSGDQVIGVFGVHLSVNHNNVQARWVPMKDVTVTSQGSVKATLDATGSKAHYTLALQVMEQALVTWSGGLSVRTGRAISDIDIAGVSVLGDGEIFATPVARDSDDTLRVTVWAPPTGGSTLVEKTAIDGVPVTAVAASALFGGPANLAAAVKQKADNKLKLIYWYVDYTGKISRLAETVQDPVGHFAISRIALNRIATASIGNGKQLTVTAWDCVTKTGGGYDAKQLGNASAPATENVGVVAIAGWTHGAVTAHQDADTNHLRLIVWLIGNDGTVTRKKEWAGIAEIDHIALVNTDQPGSAFGNQVAAAMRKTDGTMQVNVWQIASDGSDVQLTDTDAPPSPNNIKDLALTSIGPLVWTTQTIAKGHIAAAAIRNIDSSYRLMSWTVSGNGKLSRSSDFTYGGAGLVVQRVSLDYLQTTAYQGPAATTPMYNLISGVQTTDGKLDLLLWSTFLPVEWGL